MSPHQGSCEEFCNEAEDRCELGDECTNDADCEDGIKCLDTNYCGEDVCDNGRCFTLYEATRSSFRNYTGDIASCFADCSAYGWLAVGSFVRQVISSTITCRCSTQTMEPWRSDSIVDYEGQGCETVCKQAGWPMVNLPVSNTLGGCICDGEPINHP